MCWQQHSTYIVQQPMRVYCSAAVQATAEAAHQCSMLQCIKNCSVPSAWPPGRHAHATSTWFESHLQLFTMHGNGVRSAVCPHGSQQRSTLPQVASQQRKIRSSLGHRLQSELQKGRVQCLQSMAQFRNGSPDCRYVPAGLELAEARSVRSDQAPQVI